MSKIFKYELRRLIWNKFFLALLAVNGLYSWYVLTGDIISGAGYTAPFSLWSYGAYLASVMPISILTVLFLLSIYFSKKEKQVEILTSATPANPVHYALVRVGAVAIGFLVICAVIFCISIYFYVSIFGYKNFAPFFQPAVIVLIPCFIFSLGVGYLVGRAHPGLLYALMLAAVVAGFAGLGGNFDFYGRGYFNTQPVLLPIGADGEPEFVLSPVFYAARLIYTLIGAVLIWISIKGTHLKSDKTKEALIKSGASS